LGVINKFLKIKGNKMGNIFKEIKYDVTFVKYHNLQPKWFKIGKIFILLFGLVGLYLLFGITKTILFFLFFVILMLLVHLIYRNNTLKFTKSWLDYIIVEEDAKKVTKRIGLYYYIFIIINAIIAFVLSQLIV
jgi:hypothetical protein